MVMQGGKADNRNQAGARKLTMAKKIKVNIFEDLREALRDVRAYERGEDVNLRVTHFPSAPKQLTPREIRRIRRKLNASQAVFAQYLNVSANAVRSWEQGTRKGRGRYVEEESKPARLKMVGRRACEYNEGLLQGGAAWPACQHVSPR